MSQAVGVGFGVGFAYIAGNYKRTVTNVDAGTPFPVPVTLACAPAQGPGCEQVLVPGTYALRILDMTSATYACTVTVTVLGVSGNPTLGSTTCTGMDAVGAFRTFSLDASGNIS